MGRWHAPQYRYRCNRCRKPNAFHHPIEWYARPKKCKCCGHDRFYVDKQKMNPVTCKCQGYHFPHSPRSKLCEQNPLREYHLAKQHGADESELQSILIRCVKPTQSEECPF